MVADGQTLLRFAKLTEKAFAPTRGSDLAAGCDLKRYVSKVPLKIRQTHNNQFISISAYEYTIPARDKAVVLTDLAIEVPSGCYGRVAPRSGLAAKNFIDVGAGIIDEDYRGNVGVVLFNHGPEPFHVAPGDRIAQLICERIVYPVLEEVPKLDETKRGADGFGSTGTK